MPDSDDMYHIKIFSGFPFTQDSKKFTTPLYEQDYIWSKDYGLVAVDLANCLQGERECCGDPPSPNQLPPFCFGAIYFLDSWEHFS